ncbi:hypothetical protein G3573_15490, partial [Caulobacter sp. 17J65-9]|nr:hypothetical protein [Caulobacter sp. 17J65-9]
LGASHDLLAPAARAVRTAEDRVDAHSDVMVGLLTAAEDLLAQALAVPGELQEPDAARLAKTEAKLVDRAARLAEQLMRWAVTPSAPAYDPTVVADRVASLRDLMRLLTATPGVAK